VLEKANTGAPKASSGTVPMPPRVAAPVVDSEEKERLKLLSGGPPNLLASAGVSSTAKDTEKLSARLR
jgi:hypothetical protein